MPDKYDVFFDAVTKSSCEVAKNILTLNGKYMATGPSFGILLNFIRTRVTRQKAIMAATGLFWKQTDLNEICKLIEANELAPIIDSTYRLSEIDEAYKYVKKGRKVGSVLMDISDNN